MASAGKLGRDTSTTPLRKVLCIAGAHGSYVCSREMLGSKVLGQKFPYTQVQLPMMPSLNLLDPHNHNLESLSSWHTS